MQSGQANTHDWALEYVSERPQRPDPLMGWIGGAETQQQVILYFPSQEAATAYSSRQGLAYDVELPPPSAIKPKSYADNFNFGRSQNWTH
jgi:hypothetical protein